MYCRADCLAISTKYLKLSRDKLRHTCMSNIQCHIDYHIENKHNYVPPRISDVLCSAPRHSLYLNNLIGFKLTIASNLSTVTYRALATHQPPDSASLQYVYFKHPKKTQIISHPLSVSRSKLHLGKCASSFGMNSQSH